MAKGKKRTGRTKSGKLWSSVYAERSFKLFLKNNPNLSATQAQKKYNQERKAKGKKGIGKEKALDIVRSITGEEKKVERKTRFPTYKGSDFKTALFGDKHKRLIRDKWMYLVRYHVELTDGTDYENYLYVSSPTRLKSKDVKEAARDAIGDGFLQERYKFKRLKEESIEIIYEVDTEK